MHIVLSSEFSDLSEVDFRSHAAVIDRLLIAHGQSHHIFCLLPRQIARIKETISLGPIGSAILDVIAKRYQDYTAQRRIALAVMVVLPSGTGPRAPLGSEFYVAAEQLGWWLTTAPALYVENGINDGGLYRYMLRLGVTLSGGSPTMISTKAFHGGGNPLGAVIAELVGDTALGICLCDRDTLSMVPPFVTGSTGHIAHLKLHEVGVLKETTTLDAMHPFFCLAATRGWGLENNIGPHELDAFFEAHPETVESRTAFQQCFGTFPDLDTEEASLWWKINFKDAGQSAADLQTSHLAEFGISQKPHVMFTLASALTIPSNAVPFIGNASLAGRYKRVLQEASTRDLNDDDRRSYLIELGKLALTSLSADTSMRFA